MVVTTPALFVLVNVTVPVGTGFVATAVPAEHEMLTVSPMVDGLGLPATDT